MPYTGVPNQVSMLSRTHPLVRHNTHQVKDDGVIATGYLHCDGRLVVRDGADILPPVTHTHYFFFLAPTHHSNVMMSQRVQDVKTRL